MSNIGYEITFEGLGDLQATIEEAADLKPVAELTKTHTARMLQNAQRRSPKDTRFLMRSGSLSIEDAGLTGIVDFYAEYAAYQEYGTRWIVGKFYLKQSFDVESRLYLSSLERMFN